MSLPPLLRGETFIVDQNAQTALTNAKWTLEVDGTAVANGDATDLGSDVYRFSVAVPANADTKGARVLLTADGGWLVQMYTRIVLPAQVREYGVEEVHTQLSADLVGKTSNVVINPA